MKRSIVCFAVIVSLLLLFAGCELFVGPAGEKGLTGDTGATGPAGPAGEKGLTGDTGATGPAGTDGTDGTDGTNGLDGPTVYLIDNDDIRYYSGASIYIGSVKSGEPDIIKTFKIINDTNSIQYFLEQTLEFETYSDQFGTIHFSELGCLTLANSALTANLAIGIGAESPAFTFTLDSSENALIRRRYVIKLDDNGSENYNFVFEVYGYSFNSAPW